MKLQAEVVAGFETKSGTSTRTGKAYSMTEQAVLLTFPSGERKRLALSLEAPSEALPVGTVLEAKDTALYANGYRVELSLRLKHWAVVKQAAAAKAA